MKSGNFPKVREGQWMWESRNYICYGVDQKPQEYIVKRPFRVLSQKDGFVFASNLEGVSEGFGVWRDTGTNCYNKIYLVQDRIGLTGVTGLYIKKRDKSKRVCRFVGNFVESGFIPDTGTTPLAGFVNVYWVKD
jgi:hypothetical protein